MFKVSFKMPFWDIGKRIDLHLGSFLSYFCYECTADVAI